MSRSDFSRSHGNPFLTTDKLMEDSRYGSSGPRTMTRAGTMIKLFLFLAVLIGFGAYTWSKAFDAWGDFDFSTLKTETSEVNGKKVSTQYVLAEDPVTGATSRQPPPQFEMGEVKTLMWVGLIGGFFVAMFTIFVPKAACVSGFIYAGLEGLALGGVSAIYEARYPGIAMQAGLASLTTMMAMSMLFSTGLIRVGGKVTAFIVALTGGVALVYLIDIGMSAFFGTRIEVIHSNSNWGILFSGFVCALAAFNFLVDFETIEDGVENKAPKYMEWYAAFGVLLTLVWLYLEILRLLAKARSRD